MPAGRPPKYETAEQLQSKIDDYFEKGVATKKLPMKKGSDREMVEVECPTITGLVLFLGFCDRHSFYAYEKIEKFSHTIKKARTRIENHYEELLQMGIAAGPIFALKNFGWTDKQEIEHSGGIQGDVNINLVPSKKPKEE